MIVSILFSCFIYIFALEGLFVVAKNKDIFVVCLHEIAFAGYLCYGIGVCVQFLQPLHVVIILLSIFCYFGVQVLYFIVTFNAATEAVLVENAYDEQTHHYCYLVSEATYEREDVPCKLVHLLL